MPKFEIGYWCRTGMTGRGYVTEAVRGIAAFAFDVLGSKRVEIRCDPLNRPSARVAKLAGFRLEGELRTTPSARTAPSATPSFSPPYRHTPVGLPHDAPSPGPDERPLDRRGDTAGIRELGTRPGVLDEDDTRLLVHLPTRRGTSSPVWRSRPDRKGTEALNLRTVEEARAAGATRLVWHPGDAVSPPLMDDLLPRHGFEKIEDLDVLAFELGTDREPKLPDLYVPADVRAWLVRDEPDLHRANAVEAAVSPTSSRDREDTRATCSGSRTSTRARKPPARSARAKLPRESSAT